MILDKIDKISIDPSKSPIDNLQALDYLRDGLFFLAEQIQNSEKRLLGRKVRKVKECEKQIFPNDEYIFEEELVGLDFSGRWNYINCIFHWFAISAVNYVRIVGLVDYLYKNNLRLEKIISKEDGDKVNESCTKYVNKVIPEIKIFRDKVAAHFSATDPFWNENYLDWELSLMPTISTFEGLFEVNGLILGKNGLKNNELPTWSITKEFQKLKIRYW